jgi:RNA polymerase sigma-70 factor, ECF subfamily
MMWQIEESIMQCETACSKTDQEEPGRFDLGHYDPAALEDTFSQFRAKLYRIALRITGNPEDAEDALQDGLLSVFRNLHTFEGRSRFSTWLTRIVLNAALMRRRENRTRRLISIDQHFAQDEQGFAETLSDPRPNPEEIYARQEQLQCLDHVLKTIPKAYRQALYLRHVQGLTIRETAEVIGLPTNTLKSQLFRSRQRLSKVARAGH